MKIIYPKTDCSDGLCVAEKIKIERNNVYDHIIFKDMPDAGDTYRRALKHQNLSELTDIISILTFILVVVFGFLGIFEPEAIKILLTISGGCLIIAVLAKITEKCLSDPYYIEPHEVMNLQTAKPDISVFRNNHVYYLTNDKEYMTVMTRVSENKELIKHLDNLFVCAETLDKIQNVTHEFMRVKTFIHNCKNKVEIVVEPYKNGYYRIIMTEKDSVHADNGADVIFKGKQMDFYIDSTRLEKIFAEDDTINFSIIDDEFYNEVEHIRTIADKIAKLTGDKIELLPDSITPKDTMPETDII